MNRIAIIGCGCTGKSTLAVRLGEILHIEVTHLDKLYWKPGWRETPVEDWRNMQEELVKRDKWIIDGNYGATMDIRLAAADTVIFLDYPRKVCLWRYIKRLIRYNNQERPDMGPGCIEQLDFDFLQWIWTYNKEKRPTLINRLKEHPTKRVIILRSPSETEQFLRKLRVES